MSNPFLKSQPQIVDTDINLPEFDHISVELGPYSYSDTLIDTGVDRIYLRIGGNVSVFENINKEGLGNLIKALSEVHDIMVD